jgi:serine/threonine protein phosphatase PrpC
VTTPGVDERMADPSWFEAGLITETGPVREDNQDCVRIPDGEELSAPGFLCAVADGMGGYEHGGLAAQLAVDALFEGFYPSNVAAKSPQRALEEGMENANLRVFQAAQRLGAARMGTTLTAAAVRGRRLWIAHAGDSRAYLLRAGRLRCLTEDHTAVGDLVRMKIISPDKVRSHAQRSILTRAVGLGLFLQSDLFSMGLQVGDRLVLCSDGLWSAIEDEEIESITARAVSPAELNRELILLALRRESDDNASAVSVFIHSLEDEPHKETTSGGWLDRVVRGLFSGGKNDSSR